MNKILVLMFLIVLHTTVEAQSAQGILKEYFLKIPSKTIAADKDQRAEMILEERGNNLKFKAGSINGELKLFSLKNGNRLIGLSVYDCENSNLEFWRFDGKTWKDVSGDFSPKLGKKDVIAMLQVSPVTVEKLNANVSVSYYFTFFDETDEFKLVARKQESCENAGTVYSYRFNGSKFLKK